MTIRSVRHPWIVVLVFAACAVSVAIAQAPAPAPLDRSFEGLIVDGELARHRAGEDVMPELRAALEDRQRHNRGDAVRVLAELGTPAAVEELVRVANRRNDLAVGFLAINALAYMATPESSEALKHVSETHWFAPARFRAVAFDSPEGQAELLRYSISPRSLTATPDEPTRACLSFPAIDEAVSVSGPQLPEGFTLAAKGALRTPGVVNAVWIGDGWLVAESAGEWGGLLAFVSRRLDITRLANENLSYLAPFGSGWVAVESNTHRHPDVLLITRRTNGAFATRVIATAPGSVASVTVADGGDATYREGPRMGRDGRLYLTSRRWGGFVVDQTGQIEEWPCLAYGPDPLANFSY